MQPSAAFLSFFLSVPSTILLTTINNDGFFSDGFHTMCVLNPCKACYLCFLFIDACSLATLINRVEPVMMFSFHHIIVNITYEVSHEKYRIDSLRTFVSVDH